MKTYAKILSLDFEMFNSMKYWSICWIGAVPANDDLSAKECIDIKVNPNTRHKLVGRELKFPFTYGDLKKLGKFDCASKRLFPLLSGDTLVVGHAVDNDIKMLLSACNYYGLTCPDFDYIDTNAVYAVLKGSYVQYGLKALADVFGIEFEAHNPAEDARATLAVLRSMLKAAGKSLQDIDGLQVGKVRGGMVRKVYAECMTENARRHIDNFNAVFDAVAESVTIAEKPLLSGLRIAYDVRLKTVQNMYEPTKWLLGQGAKLTDPDLPHEFYLENLGTPRKRDGTIVPKVCVYDRRKKSENGVSMPTASLKKYFATLDIR